MNKRELVQARDYIAYASVYYRALKKRGVCFAYPRMMDKVFTGLNEGNTVGAYARAGDLRVSIGWECYMKYFTICATKDPSLLYYTRKYVEALEKASYHLWQARRGNGDSV